ncbi:hypothetical protein [Mesorhizobium sp. M1169]|uniref:hypothetical protein n=1 Tax=Mesorhizobium sp. M1169 TaxID=2957066 RepID=UPI00333B67D9
MRGEVLHYDEDQGFGFITGADGNRYTLAREDLRREAGLPEVRPSNSSRLADGHAMFFRSAPNLPVRPPTPPLQPPPQLRPAMRPRHVSRNISAVPLNKVRPNRLACGATSGGV